ncbi:MAG: malate synthase A [Polyangiales bacterium]
MTSLTLPPGVRITGAIQPGYERVLTTEALAFVADLARKYTARRDQLLERRQQRVAETEAGKAFDFLPETASVRSGDWKIRGVPADLQDRRVEITGPIDRKMIINALNSGAKVFMADCEDATSPTWDNEVSGQSNLMDAVRRTITYTAENGKEYRLNEKTATLLVRPRGLHLQEKHMTVDGVVVPGSLFDFGLYFFHNAKEALARGTGPYFYIPKLESHLEARWWNDVFVTAQEAIGLPIGTIKATILIETLPAAFEMDEILFELKDHIVGLNCGRWDYIFSFIKKLAHDPAKVLPDRAQVTMDKAFLKAYCELLIQTCHKRGAFAMGGMAAFIPIKGDEAANNEAIAKVRADKLREVTWGHDGTWVAHPGLVPVAMAVFDEHMPTPNQLHRLREEVTTTAADLVKIHEGTRTESGLRHNIKVGIQYMEAWLRGNGCVPLYNLMEDAATAEISRAQVWQWVRYAVPLEGGLVVTPEKLSAIIREELAKVREEIGAARFDSGKFAQASALFEKLSVAPRFAEFLTLPAYEQLLEDEAQAAS